MRKEPPFLAAVFYWFACALLLSGVGIIVYQCVHWLRFGDWPHIPLYIVFGMPPLLELGWSRQLLAWVQAPADRRIVHTLVAPLLNLPVVALVMVLSAIPYLFGSWLEAFLEERYMALLQKRRRARQPLARRDQRDRFLN